MALEEKKSVAVELRSEFFSRMEFAPKSDLGLTDAIEMSTIF
jgi:hypothetical protein